MVWWTPSASPSPFHWVSAFPSEMACPSLHKDQKAMSLQLGRMHPFCWHHRHSRLGVLDAVGDELREGVLVAVGVPAWRWWGLAVTAKRSAHAPAGRLTRVWRRGRGLDGDGQRARCGLGRVVGACQPHRYRHRGARVAIKGCHVSHHHAGSRQRSGEGDGRVPAAGDKHHGRHRASRVAGGRERERGAQLTDVCVWVRVGVAARGALRRENDAGQDNPACAEVVRRAGRLPCAQGTASGQRRRVAARGADDGALRPVGQVCSGQCACMRRLTRTPTHLLARKARRRRASWAELVHGGAWIRCVCAAASGAEVTGWAGVCGAAAGAGGAEVPSRARVGRPACRANDAEVSRGAGTCARGPGTVSGWESIRTTVT